MNSSQRIAVREQVAAFSRSVETSLDNDTPITRADVSVIKAEARLVSNLTSIFSGVANDTRD